MNENHQTIASDRDALNDLLKGNTNNPICEQQIPELLRSVTQSGGRVVVTGTGGHADSLLKIDEKGRFKY